MTQQQPMLRVQEANAYYGEIHALKNASLEVMPGEIVTLIGSNGAGKSTMLKMLSGLVPLSSGEVIYDNVRIQNLPPYEIVRMGVVHVPEGRRIFSRLTVKENIRLGAFLRKDDRAIRNDEEYVLGLFPRLRERYGQLGGLMSGGEQQMLAIARAMMSKPRLLLLDEPSMGLAPRMVDQVLQAIDAIRSSSGISILLVEQNAHKSLGISDRGYLMETGSIILHGKSEALAADPRVVETYLGVS